VCVCVRVHVCVCVCVYVCVCVCIALAYTTKDSRWVLENKIWRLLDFAGTKNPQLTGINNSTPLFSNNLVEQVYCVFSSSSSGPKYTHDW